MTMQRTYTLTAASGHVGGYAAKALLNAGHKVQALGRDVRRLRSLELAGAEILIGDLTDESYVEQAFSGVDGALLIVPPHPAAADFLGYQNEVAAIFARAAIKSGLSHAVTISCLGADDDRAGGLIAGHANIERNLNGAKGLNLVHLHACSFFEILYYFLQPLRDDAVLRTPLGPNANLEMVSARDVGENAARILDSLHFRGVSILDLNAIRSVKLTEVAELLGKELGYPIRVVQSTADADIKDLMSAGTGQTFATLLNETWAMATAMGEMPTSKSRPPTTARYAIETFVRENLAPAVRSAASIFDYSTAIRPRKVA